MKKTRSNVEDAFLSVLRQGADNETIDGRFRSFADADWQRLYDFGVKYSLSSPFYGRLSKLRLKNVPSGILSRLKNLYIANLRRSLFLEKELFDILRRLKESNIPVIPLKGYALARHVYGDTGLRNASCDLDLLVNREKVPEAEKVFAEMGYRFAAGKTPEFWHNFRTEIMFQKRSQEVNSLLLDLHWDFRNRFVNTHVDDFWLNAREMDADAVQMLVPSDEDLLVYLVLTAVSDMDFVSLKYLYDLHTLIAVSGGDMDWQKVMERVSALGLKTALYYALYLSKDIFATSVPDAALNGARPGIIKRSFCSLVLNRKNVVKFGKEIALRWSWRHAFSHYVLTDKVIDCMRIYLDKMFPPMGEVMGMYNQPVTKRSYYIYTKKLLKPFTFKMAKETRIPTCHNSISK